MIKEEFWGRCCRRESVFPADNSSVTRGDGLNFPFGKTRRIRVNKSSMQTAKPNNVFVLSVISDLRFRLKSPRNSTWRRSRLSKPWAEKWSWCFLWIRKKAKAFRRPDNRSRPGTEIRWPPSKTLFILRCFYWFTSCFYFSDIYSSFEVVLINGITYFKFFTFWVIQNSN